MACLKAWPRKNIEGMGTTLSYVYFALIEDCGMTDNIACPYNEGYLSLSCREQIQRPKVEKHDGGTKGPIPC